MSNDGLPHDRDCLAESKMSSLNRRCQGRHQQFPPSPKVSVESPRSGTELLRFGCSGGGGCTAFPVSLFPRLDCTVHQMDGCTPSRRSRRGEPAHAARVVQWAQGVDVGGHDVEPYEPLRQRKALARRQPAPGRGEDAGCARGVEEVRERGSSFGMPVSCLHVDHA